MTEVFTEDTCKEETACDLSKHGKWAVSMTYTADPSSLDAVT